MRNFKVIKTTSLLENPANNSKILSTLNTDTFVNETGEKPQGSYVKVTAGDKSGWVLSKDVSSKEQVKGKPSKAKKC